MAETAELVDLRERRDDAVDTTVAHWGTGPSVLPWTQVVLDLIEKHKSNAVRAGRALALAHVAAYDALVAVADARARSWAGDPGTVTPAGPWIEIARDLVWRDGLDAAHAARVPAPTGVAMGDAFVCCWDAKCDYWTERPITADPTLDVLFPTAPFPSYSSGHSTISTAAATVLGHLFPADAADLAARAAEARDSRLWAGIHFPIDNEIGAAMGGMVGRLVAEVARGDGAEQASAPSALRLGHWCPSNGGRVGSRVG